MVANALVAKVDRVERLEKDIEAARQQVGRVLRLAREVAGLSLRDVAQGIRMSHQTIANIESGKTWQTQTARRVAKFYESLAA